MAEVDFYHPPVVFEYFFGYFFPSVLEYLGSVLLLLRSLESASADYVCPEFVMFQPVLEIS